MTLSEEDYLALPAVNWSTLKHLRESPLHYRHALTAPSRETDAMRIGTATHIAVLEPETFADRVAVWEGERRAGNAYKEWLAENEGKLHLRTQDLAGIDAIATSVRAHPAAARLLSEGEAEVTLRWTDEETGLECKGRADFVTPAGALVDLKTTRSTHPARFGRQAAVMGYHCQLAFYRMGLRAMGRDVSDVYIIAVESTPPHDVAVFWLDPDAALWAGEEEVRTLLRQLADLTARDEWPGRCPDVQPLELPSWVFGDDEDDAFDGLTVGGED